MKKRVSRRRNTRRRSSRRTYKRRTGRRNTGRRVKRRASHNNKRRMKKRQSLVGGTQVRPWHDLDPVEVPELVPSINVMSYLEPEPEPEPQVPVPEPPEDITQRLALLEDYNINLDDTEVKLGNKLGDTTQEDAHALIRALQLLWGDLLSLELQKNKLTALPEFLGNFPKLERLYLNSNRLTTLPETFFSEGNLPKLRRLNLRGNNITNEEYEYIIGALRERGCRLEYY